MTSFRSQPGWSALRAVLFLASLASLGAAPAAAQAQPWVAAPSCGDGHFNQTYRLPVPAIAPGAVLEVGRRYASGVSCEVPGYGYLTATSVYDGDEDGVLLLVDYDGAPLRGFRYGDDADHVSITSVVPAHEPGHVVVTGRVDLQLWVAKIHMPSGTTVWSRSLGAPGWGEEGTFIRTLSADEVGAQDYLIVGRIFDAFWNFAYLARVSDDGVVRWARRYDDVAAANPTRDYETVAVGEGPEVWVTGIRNELAGPATRDLSILRVRVTTGDNVPVVFYYQHAADPPAHLAERTPHLVPTSDGYVASLGMRRPGVAFDALSIFLDPALNVTSAQWLGVPGSPFDMGHSVFWEDDRLLVSTTADDEAGFLSMLPDGTVASHAAYGQRGSVSPMTQLSSGYLLRSTAFDGSTLGLVHAGSAGEACCAEPLALSPEDVAMTRASTTYGSMAWGADAAHFVPGPFTMWVKNVACR